MELPAIVTDEIARVAWPTPGTAEEAEFGPAQRTVVEADMLRDLDYGASRALAVVAEAIRAGIAAGLVRTPEDAVLIIDRVSLHFTSHDG